MKTKDITLAPPFTGGDWHTMFKEVEAEIYRYRIFIDDFMESGPGLHDMYNQLLQAQENDVLELRINSHGGVISELQQFHSIIKNMFFGRTITILDPKGYSCGALIFCMGDTRVVHEYSEIMFHDYSAGFSGKGGELESQVKHNSKFLRTFMKDIIKDFLTDEEFDKMVIGQDFWFDTEEMCKRGIATHVMLQGYMVEAKEYLKALRKTRTMKRQQKAK
jgi:ATP-dependent protease ClpP protease subunit